MSTPYASAAPHHARHRPPYPAELHALLADRFALDGSQTVLDLGAGSRTIAPALAPLVEQVYVVAPEPAVLAEGCALAEEQGHGNISWLRGDAADIGRLCLPRIDLCVIGDAFHRMDQERVVADLAAVLAPRGGIAVVTSLAVACPAAVDEDRARFLGPGTGPGEGTDHVRDAEERLAKSEFSRVETTRWERSSRCTVDQVIDLQFSRDSSRPALLGDRQDAFASDVRGALPAHDPGGVHTCTVTVAATVATRPRR